MEKFRDVRLQMTTAVDGLVVTVLEQIAC